MHFSRNSARALRFATTALLLLPTLAHAHPGHPGHDDGGLFDGIAHPFSGLDHLLAMIAIGLWAVQLGGRALWLVPASFVSLMALGGALGIGGVVPPMLEQGIVASVFLLGLFILGAWRMPLVASATLAGLFAVFHGAAHGAEMPAGSHGLLFGAGMIASTLVLHACGLAAGLMLRSEIHRHWIRLAGAGVIAGSVVLALH